MMAAITTAYFPKKPNLFSSVINRTRFVIHVRYNILSYSLLLSRKLCAISKTIGSEYHQIFRFLDATTHLYKRSCPSVRPSVRRMVRPQLFSNAEYGRFLG